jgi:hypothetical protein
MLHSRVCIHRRKISENCTAKWQCKESRKAHFCSSLICSQKNINPKAITQFTKAMIHIAYALTGQLSCSRH